MTTAGTLRVMRGEALIEFGLSAGEVSLLVVSEDVEGVPYEWAVQFTWSAEDDPEHRNGEVFLRPSPSTLGALAGNTYSIGGGDSSACIYHHEHWYVPASLEVISYEGQRVRARIIYFDDSGRERREEVDGWFSENSAGEV